MRKVLATLGSLVLLLSVTPAISATPGGQSGERAPRLDNRPDPLTQNQLALKQLALDAKLNGKAHGKTMEAAKGQFVQLTREGEGQLWTVLGEFSDFSHNNIDPPDRSVDNTTLWVDDFSRDHYMNMLFNDAKGANSMRNFYIEQSSGRYTVAGDVTDWVQVPGDHTVYDDNPDANVWLFINDSIDAWYASQVADGKTATEINDYLATLDVWDRYDYDGDDNFDEPDGYIDTFQSVHSGEGEEAGGGALGSEAIWSHSWYAYYNANGPDGTGPHDFGGIQIGDSDFWVGKYTIQPENGGVGVFAHEYGHDLGLPDLYDTSGGENGTAFWTLMSSGSWIDTGEDQIGNKPSHMGAWEKFQLGWLNYGVAVAGQTSSHKLGPMEFNTRQEQALFVILPKKEVVSNIGAPFDGSHYYYSSAGDVLDNFMYKAFDLPAGATLTAKVKYSIELDYDYAYLVYSADNGTTWTPIQTNLSTNTDPNLQNKGFGITGSSGGNWVDLTANLPTGNVLLGFRYWTDANTGGFGFMLDNLDITGSPTDGAESDTGWTFDPTSGFHVTTGVESALFSNYYVLEHRTYRGYDDGLRTGPYYFGYPTTKPDYVDHFAYQDGLLINYWDTSQRNNNTNQHPGAGLLLPIDAHYAALERCGGPAIWRNRVQSYDSTFTLSPTDGIPNIHHNEVLCPVDSLPAVSVFDDRTEYWDPANPMGSVKNPDTGTQVRILGISATGFMQVEVRPAK